MTKATTQSITERVTKLFSAAATSINETDHTVVFRISDGKPDRQGEIIDQKSWDFTDYMQNPLLIASHDASDIENGLGTALKLWYDESDDSTYGLFKLAVEASQKAQTAWNLIKAGVLRTVSVGFISNETEWVDGTPVLKNNQLLETSLVLVPANPRAIALSFKDGTLNRKDAEWLRDSMQKEVELIDKQLEQKEETESTMSKESETALLGAIESLTKGMEALGTKVEAISTKGAVADIAAVEDRWDLQDDKWDAMEPISALYYALQEAYFYSATPVDGLGELLAEFITLLQSVAAGTYEEKAAITNEALAKALESVKAKDIKGITAKSLGIETVEKAADEVTDETTDEDTNDKPEDAENASDTTDGAEKTADDDQDKDKEDVEKSEDTDDSAKDGGDDQSGADADEFDEDAELTPELEAQIDEELAKAASN